MQLFVRADVVLEVAHNRFSGFALHAGPLRSDHKVDVGGLQLAAGLQQILNRLAVYEAAAQFQNAAEQLVEGHAGGASQSTRFVQQGIASLAGYLNKLADALAQSGEAYQGPTLAALNPNSEPPIWQDVLSCITARARQRAGRARQRGGRAMRKTVTSIQPHDTEYMV